MELIIGCVGKPSAGKSTFFNAVTDGKAKTGNFPFTTIEPNQGIAYYLKECACKSRDKVSLCSPIYGKCEDGIRHVPVKLLDVAGLIPGASDGAGLGNKFLDDLRHAHVLMHIIDVSGTTNEKGEETLNYDPINDADWLLREIHAWIFNNLWKKWQTIVKRNQAKKSTPSETLSGQLSGYGAGPSIISIVLDKLGIRETCNFEEWGEEQVHELVTTFIKVRFPLILVLNKADSGGNTDHNIEKIVEKYGSERCFVSSAAAECFLKAAVKQKYIHYTKGSMFYSTLEDDDASSSDLQVIPMKISKRLEKISDMVLYRYGSTGVQAAINAAVELANCFLVYPVRSIKNYTADSRGKHVFGNALLVKQGTTIGELAHHVSSTIGTYFLYAEGSDGRRLGIDDVVDPNNNIIKFTTKNENTVEK